MSSFGSVRRLCDARLSCALTRREMLVLEALVQGKGNKEIAVELGCSVKTIEFHVSNILRKAQAPNRNSLLSRMLLRTEPTAVSAHAVFPAASIGLDESNAEGATHRSSNVD